MRIRPACTRWEGTLMTGRLRPESPFFLRIVQDDVKRVGKGLYVGALHLTLWASSGSSRTSACNAPVTTNRH